MDLKYLRIRPDMTKLTLYLNIRLSPETFPTDVADVRLALAMCQHVFLHVPGPSELFMTDLTLVVPPDIVSLRQVVLVVRLVVELRLAPLAGVRLDDPLTDLGVSLQVAVRDELFFTAVTLKPLPLGQRDVLLKVSHDLREEYKVISGLSKCHFRYLPRVSS